MLKSNPDFLFMSPGGYDDISKTCVIRIRALGYAVNNIFLNNKFCELEIKIWR